MGLISLNLEQPALKADFEFDVPTGGTLPNLSNVQAWEQILIGVATSSGVTVTPEKARRCSAVLACMRGISEDLSGLPLPLFKRGELEDTIQYEHSVHQILNISPHPLLTPMELREHLVFELILHGNFYVLPIEDPNNPGQLASVWPLQAGYVVRRWRESVWTYTDPVTGLTGAFDSDNIWRGSIMSANGGIDGVAITLLAKEAIGLLIAAEQQGARLFAQGIQSDLVIETNDGVDMGEDEQKQLRASLVAKYSGSQNAWMPLLLNGLKAKRIGLTAQESQYIEARNYQVADVARVFRYPEVLLGTSSARGATLPATEQFFNSYSKHSLGPWATRIEQTINRDLLTTKERAKCYVSHDFSPLLKADQAGRDAHYASAIDKGWMTPAQAARAERLPYDPKRSNAYVAAPTIGSAPPTDPLTTSKPTDVGALADRVATFLVRKEIRALSTDKQSAITFYPQFGAFVENLTGASTSRAAEYVQRRMAEPDPMSADALTRATDHLLMLCKG